jgi:transcriptional regulator with XRE-family HTH domain
MDDNNINGGPNHLTAWREWKGWTQAELASRVETTQGQIAHLESERRALSAKWLRKLADALGITPGWLLDTNPYDISADLLDIWSRADPQQRKQISDIAAALVKSGTDG